MLAALAMLAAFQAGNRARIEMAKHGVPATLHDYARIWRRLKPGERDRRITQALDRLAEGETLAQVAATWSIQKSALCRALIAYAPQEWRGALAARALLRYHLATERFTEEPKNPVARARAWATRWHLEYELGKLGNPVALKGQEFVGPCIECGNRTAYAKIGRPARCFKCGWEGNSKRYLLKRVRATKSHGREVAHVG